jgi:hypothetical protein
MAIESILKKVSESTRRKLELRVDWQISNLDHTDWLPHIDGQGVRMP